MNSLKSIGGAFTINHTSLLQQSFTGLDSLSVIGENFNFYLSFELTNFEGLESLTVIGGLFNVSNAHDLVNFEGLTNLTECSG